MLGLVVVYVAATFGVQVGHCGPGWGSRLVVKDCDLYVHAEAADDLAIEFREATPMLGVDQLDGPNCLQGAGSGP